MQLELAHIDKAYDAQPVLRDLSLRIEPGQIACLLGPSGCGKTTALRVIAGFETIDAGQLRGDGRLLAGGGAHVAPEQRNIGMVFQEHALLPHLTVRQNVALGLRSLPAADRDTRIDDTLALVGLTAWAERYPHQLSGGQSQRVALARSLAPRPRALLLDEPFTGMNPEETKRMMALMFKLRDSGITLLLVEHDMHAIMGLCDRITVMSFGRFLAEGGPQEIRSHPEVIEAYLGGARHDA